VYHRYRHRHQQR